MNRMHPFWKEKLESADTIKVELVTTMAITQTDPVSPQPLLASNTLEDGFDYNEVSDSDDDHIPADDPRATAGKFLLMLKERHRMSQTAISFAIGSVRKLIAYTCDHVRATATAAGVNINAEDIDPFYGLETEYFQTKYYKEYLGLAVSHA